MRAFPRGTISLLLALTAAACILRPGMNADCAWPPETPRHLDLAHDADRRHLVIDAELVEELVDRYRFHVPNDQPACERRLVAAVAQMHGVAIRDVTDARDRIPGRGFDLAVNLPMATLFVLAALAVMRWISIRFGDERLPTVLTFVLASVILSGLFVLIGEFWTSILQMIRVGSQHVGGRVARLPWKRHFFVGILLFWTVLLIRYAFGRGMMRRAGST